MAALAAALNFLQKIGVKSSSDSSGMTLARVQTPSVRLAHLPKQIAAAL
jgi:hypothetical protein